MDTMERILELMKKNKITQKQLCDYLGIGEPKFSDWKKGKIKSYNKYLPQIASFFGVSTDYLLYGADYSTLGLMPVSRKKYRILGDIACGEPIYADEHYESYFEADKDIDADFCLTAKGDSMINARIFDGDVVFIKQQSDVENGEIAAVIINGEATLKRVYKYSGRIELRAENPLYQSLNFEGEQLNGIRILGKAVAFQSFVR